MTGVETQKRALEIASELITSSLKGKVVGSFVDAMQKYTKLTVDTCANMVKAQSRLAAELLDKSDKKDDIKKGE